MDTITEKFVEFYERFSSWEHSVVKDSELTLPQMHTIEILGNHKTLRMKDLAEKLGVVMGTLSVMVNRLSDMELLQRVKNPNDSRSYFLSLTKKGHQVYQNHHELHKEFAQEILTELSEKELKVFEKLLAKVIRNM